MTGFPGDTLAFLADVPAGNSQASFDARTWSRTGSSSRLFIAGSPDTSANASDRACAMDRSVRYFPDPGLAALDGARG